MEVEDIDSEVGEASGNAVDVSGLILAQDGEDVAFAVAWD